MRIASVIFVSFNVWAFSLFFLMSLLAANFAGMFWYGIALILSGNMLKLLLK